MENALTLPRYLESKPVIQKFTEVLGKNTQAFLASLLTIYNEDEKLRKCDPVSILAAAKQAAILQLPIVKQFGYAYVIPYYDARNKKYVATFQMGYKGFLQLAMRTGVFRNINADAIYDGQIKNYNYITGEFDLTDRTSDSIIGYFAYMELINGFRKTLFMTKADVEDHARNYSQSYAYDLKNGTKSSIWSKNFDSMAKKTVLKKLLNTYAPTSIELQNNELATAIRADQAVISKDTYSYIDNSGDTVDRTDNTLAQNVNSDTVDVEDNEIYDETGEILTIENAEK